MYASVLHLYVPPTDERLLFDRVQILYWTLNEPYHYLAPACILYSFFQSYAKRRSFIISQYDYKQGTTSLNHCGSIAPTAYLTCGKSTDCVK